MEKVAIYDLNGKLIDLKVNVSELSIEGLTTGLYVLRIENKNSVNGVKILKP